MCYLESMEKIDSDIMDKVLVQVKEYDYTEITVQDVKKAISSNNLSITDFAALLSPAAESLLEEMACRAKNETEKRFGNSINLFTPLYLANYCENHCLYCGFNCKNSIQRGRLSYDEIDKELSAISKTGLTEILLLTGESRKKSGLEYIGEAVNIARKYFSAVGIEIYPLNTDEYNYIHQKGADFVSVYQETYDPKIYEINHLQGPKRIYPYRFHSQERAIRGGMRGVAFGSLLGLGDFRKDAFATGVHSYFIQQKYPHVEISFSAPRLRSYINDNSGVPCDVTEKELFQVIMAYRIFMPSAAITISTRERSTFRDNVIGVAATKISAGVSVGVGGHYEENKGDTQFEIADSRSVSEIHEMIIKKRLQPVYNDYIFIS